MSDIFAYLRWRLIVGLIMISISAVAAAVIGKGASAQHRQPSAEETEQRRNWKEYEAEREISRAKRTDGYDPSDPYTVRDGYQTEEYNRDTYSNPDS